MESTPSRISDRANSLLSRPRWFGKSIVETLVTLPLVMPPVATGLILLKLLGRRGRLTTRRARTIDQRSRSDLMDTKQDAVRIGGWTRTRCRSWPSW